MKIISLAPFTHIIQGSTPAFQLHISLVLLEGHLSTDNTTPEPKAEKQILHKYYDPLPTPETEAQLQNSNPLKTTPTTILGLDRYLANHLSNPWPSLPVTTTIGILPTIHISINPGYYTAHDHHISAGAGNT
ncbi:hypothetical protein C0993_008336 [Termitomyces sp. T159_Od127]|nr:hypothetical protein C0993_008336 [Termitomyces sp. T159_Od127]